MPRARQDEHRAGERGQPAADPGDVGPRTQRVGSVVGVAIDVARLVELVERATGVPPEERQGSAHPGGRQAPRERAPDGAPERRRHPRQARGHRDADRRARALTPLARRAPRGRCFEDAGCDRAAQGAARPTEWDTTPLMRRRSAGGNRSPPGDGRPRRARAGRRPEPSAPRPDGGRSGLGGGRRRRGSSGTGPSAG